MPRVQQIGQGRERAHLRPLPTCGGCRKRPATQELRNGFNGVMGVYCGRCASGALRRYKETGEL